MRKYLHVVCSKLNASYLFLWEERRTIGTVAVPGLFYLHWCLVDERRIQQNNCNHVDHYRYLVAMLGACAEVDIHLSFFFLVVPRTNSFCSFNSFSAIGLECFGVSRSGSRSLGLRLNQLIISLLVLFTTEAD